MDIVKLLMLAAGAYFVWQWFQGTSTQPTTPAAGPSATTAPAGTTASGQPPATQVVSQMTLLQRIHNAIQTGLYYRETGWSTANADEWNWLVQQITGQVQPAPETFGAGDRQQLTAEAYLLLRQQYGV